MAIFKKSKKNQISLSKDSNLQAMAITASHICDASFQDKELTGSLENIDWELIWSSILFGSLRYMSTAESIDFTNNFIQFSKINDELKAIHKKVSTAPDSGIFSSLSPDHQRWLNTVNQQIYEIAFEEGLIRHTNVNRQYIYEQVLPMVEHYVTRNADPLTKTHLAFTQIVSSSIALAAEDIISQEPTHGLQLTKDRYGACQVVFALAIFLFMQRV